MEKRDRTKYYKEYMSRRRKERREMAIKLLGGQCVRCGSTEALQFDHIDPTEKSFPLSGCDVSLVRFLEEVKKCQLLCQKCHSDKTILDLGKRPAKGTHGTLSSYRYCHCEECKRAKREYVQRCAKKRKIRKKQKD